jgi:hypothetical protein
MPLRLVMLAGRGGGRMFYRRRFRGHRADGNDAARAVLGLIHSQTPLRRIRYAVCLQAFEQ